MFQATYRASSFAMQLSQPRSCSSRTSARARRECVSVKRVEPVDARSSTCLTGWSRTTTSTTRRTPTPSSDERRRRSTITTSNGIHSGSFDARCGTIVRISTLRSSCPLFFDPAPLGPRATPSPQRLPHTFFSAICVVAAVLSRSIDEVSLPRIDPASAAAPFLGSPAVRFATPGRPPASRPRRTGRRPSGRSQPPAPHIGVPAFDRDDDPGKTSGRQHEVHQKPTVAAVTVRAGMNVDEQEVPEHDGHGRIRCD